MPESWVSDLTTDLLWAEDLDAARAAFRRMTANEHVDFYAYGNARRGLDPPFVESSYPAEWISLYLERRYQFIDPVVEQARKSHLPFFWRFLTNRPDELSETQREIFREAARFGIRDGYTIPFHNEEGCFAMLSFAFGSSEEMLRVLADPTRLQLMGVYFHATVDRLLGPSGQEGVLSTMERQSRSWRAAGRSLLETAPPIRNAPCGTSLSMPSSQQDRRTESPLEAAIQTAARGLPSS